jgi:multidrug efflux system outer membrane protein
METGEAEVLGRRGLAGLVVGLIAASGCVVGPSYVPPEPELPDVWQQELVSGLESGDAGLEAWWTNLSDPTLTSLIRRAREGNLDLRQSVARIQAARAVRGIAGSERFPDVDGVGTEQRTRSSEQVTPVIPSSQRRTDTFYGIGGEAFWEVDLWGRITRSIESADASLEVSIEDYRDVLVSLYAEVAISYVELRALQARIRSTEGNIRTQRDSHELTVNRRNAGIGSDLDVSQALLNLSSTESFLPGLRAQLAAQVHALGVLIGEQPSALRAELAPEGAIPAPPPEVMVGVPTNLLRQRPDVRASERELAAQTARIGIATADLYPSFSLVGTFAWESFSAGNWLEGGSRSYGFGPAFRWNLFDGGRVRQTIAVEDARTEESLARYEQTVLFALQDVEDSLVAYVEEIERRDALQRAVDAARRAVELVTVNYRIGLTDFQNVLDTERSLFAQEDALAESQGRITQNLVRIYRALGGGWTAPTN